LKKRPEALEEEIRSPAAVVQIAVTIERVDENGGPGALVQIPVATAQELAAAALSHQIRGGTRRAQPIKAIVNKKNKDRQEESIHKRCSRKEQGRHKCNVSTVASGGEKNLSLVFGSVYYIMNTTCIHLTPKGLNIYIYRRGNI
jgi:hypothetical protein